MTEHYHVPEWDCPDDIIEVTEDIGIVASKMLLGEFISRTEGASKQDVERILQAFVQRNVEAALKLAAQGLLERLQPDRDIPDGCADGRIDIMEAVRIVRELDYISDDD